MSYIEGLLIDSNPIAKENRFGNELVPEGAIGLITVEDALSSVTHILAMEILNTVVSLILSKDTLNLILDVVDVQ